MQQRRKHSLRNIGRKNNWMIPVSKAALSSFFSDFNPLKVKTHAFVLRNVVGRWAIRHLIGARARLSTTWINGGSD